MSALIDFILTLSGKILDTLGNRQEKSQGTSSSSSSQPLNHSTPIQIINIVNTDQDDDDLKPNNIPSIILPPSVDYTNTANDIPSTSRVPKIILSPTANSAQQDETEGFTEEYWIGLAADIMRKKKSGDKTKIDGQDL